MTLTLVLELSLSSGLQIAPALARVLSRKSETERERERERERAREGESSVTTLKLIPQVLSGVGWLHRICTQPALSLRVHVTLRERERGGCPDCMGRAGSSDNIHHHSAYMGTLFTPGRSVYAMQKQNMYIYVTFILQECLRAL